MMGNGKIVFELDASKSNLAIYEFVVRLSRHTEEQILDVLSAAENHFEENNDTILGNPNPLFSKKAIEESLDDSIEPLFTEGIFAPGACNNW